MKFESTEELGEEERNAGSWPPPACEDERLGELRELKSWVWQEGKDECSEMNLESKSQIMNGLRHVGIFICLLPNAREAKNAASSNRGSSKTTPSVMPVTD